MVDITKEKNEAMVNLLEVGGGFVGCESVVGLYISLFQVFICNCGFGVAYTSMLKIAQIKSEWVCFGGVLGGCFGGVLGVSKSKSSAYVVC